MNRHFILVLICFILSIISGFAQKLKPDYQKNSIQIGKTGYYFDKENPFGFGQVSHYFPYIGYTRKISPKIGLKISMEYYTDCYVCDDFSVWPPSPVFTINYRTFNLLEINFLHDFLVTKRLSLILCGGTGYRWAPFGEGWAEAYIDHGLWREAFYSGKSFHEWGVGGAIEVKYKFYKQFSLSLKGEYFSFPARPVRHWGAGMYLGYDF